MAKAFDSASSFENSEYKHMSERQQTLYLLNLTRSDSLKSDTRNTDADIDDLQGWHDEVKQKERRPNPRKQAERQLLLEEASMCYRAIKRSIYLERKPVRVSANDSMVCTCKAPYLITEGQFAGHYTRGCGRKCLNRLLSTECFAETCPAKELCTNRVFQKQMHCNVYPIRTEKCGWGLAAGQLITKGTFIIQYVGEIFSVDSEIGAKRIEKYRGSPCVYLMSTSQNEVIDPTTRGNLARFINHSCDPNSETQKWNVLGEICIGIFAKRDIAEDEELTFDYRFDAHKTAFTKCLCGTAKCRKFLGYCGSDITIERLKRSMSDCDKCREIDRCQELVKCFTCSRSFHLDCTDPPLKKKPKVSWKCELCKPVSSNSVKEWKAVVTRRTLEIIRLNLEEVIGHDTKIVWDKVDNGESFEVMLRGNDVSRAREKVETIQYNTIHEIEARWRDVGEVELKVPVCFLRLIAGPNCREFQRITEEHSVMVTFDDKLLDQPLPQDTCTSLILTGYMSVIDLVALEIFETLDTLGVIEFDLLASEVDSKITQILALKEELKPIELHFPNKPFSIGPKSPLGIISPNLCKGFLIGPHTELRRAYRRLTSILADANQERTESHYIIIPEELRQEAEARKTSILASLQTPSPVQINIEKRGVETSIASITLIGTWRQCMASVQAFAEALFGFEDNSQYVDSRDSKERQLIRYMLKDATRYLYFRFHKPEEHLPMLKYWDVYTAAVLIPNYTERQAKQLRNLVEHGGVLFYYLSLADPAGIRACIGEAEGAIKQIVLELESFFYKFMSLCEAADRKPPYDNIVLNEFNQTFIEAGTVDVDIPSLIALTKKESDRSKEFIPFTFSPLSYRLNPHSPPEDLMKKIAPVMDSIDNMKFIRCFGKNVIQQIQVQSVPIGIREKADLVVSCQNEPKNFLYVVFNKS